MKLYNITSSADGYSYFYEGEMNINGFPLRVELFSDEEGEAMKNGYLNICITSETDERYSNFSDETINDYCRNIDKILKEEYAFESDNSCLMDDLYKEEEVPLYKNSRGKFRPDVESYELYFTLIEDDLRKRLSLLVDANRWDYKSMDIKEIKSIFRSISWDDKIPYNLTLLSAKALSIEKECSKDNKIQLYKVVELKQNMKTRTEVWDFAKELIVKEGNLLCDEAYKKYMDSKSILDKREFSKEFDENVKSIVDSVKGINKLQEVDEQRQLQEGDDVME